MQGRRIADVRQVKKLALSVVAFTAGMAAEPAHACYWGPFGIHFARGSTTVSPDTKHFLDGYVWAFKEYGWSKARILVTLTPERGQDRQTNLRLFDQRAVAIRSYVSRQGLPAWRVKMTYADKVNAPGEFGKSIAINGSVDVIEGGCR